VRELNGDLFLGLDVGTQGTKGLIVNSETRSVVARASAPYDLIPGLAPGAAEQHPETWMDAVRTVVRNLLAEQEVDSPRISGVGVSGQQHGFVALDENDQVIRPAKLWCDVSTSAEARELSEAYGRSVPTGFTASKILWMKRHEPENFGRLCWVLLPHDYVNFRLTGIKTMEAGDASGTAFFDSPTRRFNRAEVEAIDPKLTEMLPPLLAPGEPAGRITQETAHDLGLPQGIPVSSGGGDNMMSAIGSGATRPGVVVISLGTSGTVFTYSPAPVLDPDGLIAPFCDSTGGWLPLLCVMNVTGVTEEIRSAFSLDRPSDLESITEAASRVVPGCQGLTLLPYLQGERVPDLPEATGTLLGWRPGLFRPEILFRAAVEATSLNLGWGADRMRALGIAIDSVRLVGGASPNPLWRRILADVLAAPIHCIEEPESGALGAAIQAYWTVLRVSDNAVTADEVAQLFVRTTEEVVEPDRDSVAIYRELSKRFREAVGRIYSQTGTHG
jgi:xylulokinase